MVLWQQVSTDDDHGDPVAVRLLSVPLPHLYAAEFQVPVYISGSAGPDLERLGQQTHRHPCRATFRPDPYSSTLW